MSVLCADGGRLLCSSSFGPTYEPERDPRGAGGRQHQPPPCPYGSACRETSARHFIEFSHMASSQTLFSARDFLRANSFWMVIFGGLFGGGADVDGLCVQTDVCERAPAAVPLALADRPAEARAYTQVRLCLTAETAQRGSTRAG